MIIYERKFLVKIYFFHSESRACRRTQDSGVRSQKSVLSLTIDCIKQFRQTISTLGELPPHQFAVQGFVVRRKRDVVNNFGNDLAVAQNRLPVAFGDRNCSLSRNSQT